MSDSPHDQHDDAPEGGESTREPVRFSTLARVLTPRGIETFRVDASRLALVSKHWDAVALAVQGDRKALSNLETHWSHAGGLSFEFDVDTILANAARALLSQSRGA